MVDTTELTGLISALRAETEADSVSPERVGYVLQQIVNFLPSLDSSGLTDDVATALATARQALTSAQGATTTAQSAQTAATSAQNVANAASSTANAASTLAGQCESAVAALTTLVGQLQTASETATSAASEASAAVGALQEGANQAGGMVVLDANGKVPHGLIPDDLANVLEFSGVLNSVTVTSGRSESKSTDGDAQVFFVESLNQFVLGVRTDVSLSTVAPDFVAAPQHAPGAGAQVSTRLSDHAVATLKDMPMFNTLFTYYLDWADRELYSDAQYTPLSLKAYVCTSTDTLYYWKSAEQELASMGKDYGSQLNTLGERMTAAETAVGQRLFLNGNKVVNRMDTATSLAQFLALTDGSEYAGIKVQGVVVTLYTDDGMETWQWDGTTWSSAAAWSKFGGSGSATGNVVNVNEIAPRANGFYNRGTAANAVPEELRTGGRIITFESAAGVWQRWQFTGTLLADWADETCWVPDVRGISFNDAAAAVPDRNGIINLNYHVTVDEVLNSESSNPIANKTVTAALEQLRLGLAAGLSVDPVSNQLSLLDANGEVMSSVTLPSGGGGATNPTAIELTIDSAMSATIKEGTPHLVEYTWRHYNITTNVDTQYGGRADLIVNGSTVTSVDVTQGIGSFDVSPWLSVGTNSLRVRITADDGVVAQSAYIKVTVVTLGLSSSYSLSTVTEAGTPIPFRFVVTGSGAKVVNFELDGAALPTETVTTSGGTSIKSIPTTGLSHGAHSLEVWAEREIADGVMLESNHLYFDLMITQQGTTDVIVATEYDGGTIEQYQTLIIPFAVYDPLHTTCEVEVTLDGILLTSMEVDRTRQTLSWRSKEAGSYTFVISAGGTSRTIEVTVTAAAHQVTAETAGLALWLSSSGRSNAATNRADWSFTPEGGEALSAVFHDVGWDAQSGWLPDEHGLVSLHLAGGARCEIPLNLFASDCKLEGKTIEVEFKASKCYDESAVLISCLSDGVGFAITAQDCYLQSALRKRVGSKFKQDERVRVSFVIQRTDERRFMMMYLDGILSGVEQYDTSDYFVQNTPVGITLGNALCELDVWNVRVYDTSLSMRQMVNNFIADMDDTEVMFAKLEANDVLNDDNADAVDYDKAVQMIPCITFIGTLPTYKGDKKKDTKIIFEDRQHPEYSFTCGKAQTDVQGTSSQYYPRKNWKLKFLEEIQMTQSGATQKKYALRGVDGQGNAVAQKAVKTFCLKADFAESSGSHNTGAANFINEVLTGAGILTPPQRVDATVRTTVYGFPVLMFHQETENSPRTFIGKYNFNNDKSTQDTFGFEKIENYNDAMVNRGDWLLWDGSLASLQGDSDAFEASENGELMYLINDSTDTSHYRHLAEWNDGSGAWVDKGELWLWDYASRTWKNRAGASITVANGLTEARGGKLIENNVECWEFLNNAHPMCLFHSSDWIGTVTGDSIPSWFDRDRLPNDGGTIHAPYWASAFEPRYPDSDDLNAAYGAGKIPTQLRGVVDWLVNLDISDENLSASQLADRKAAFLAGYQSYFHKDMMLAYDNIREVLIASDQGAKNMMWVMFDGLCYPIFYDNDTLWTLNNEGRIQFHPYVELHDKDALGKDVFNGESSTLWNLIEQTLETDKSANYERLVSQGNLTYARALYWFNERQSDRWCETIYNQDTKYKYLDSFGVVGGADNTAQNYLDIAQGSRSHHRKWVMSERFAYVNAKRCVGSYRESAVYLRANTAGASTVPSSVSVTVTAAQDWYFGFRFSGNAGYSSRLIRKNESYTFSAPAGSQPNDTETYIYQADRIKSLGDLSALYPTSLVVGNCRLLEELIVGNSTQGYVGKLASLTLGTHPLLRYINVVNCATLQSTLDASGCRALEEIDARGSRITSVLLPTACTIDTLRLPSSVVQLQFDRLPNLTYEGLTLEGYGSIQTLDIVGCPNLDAVRLLGDILATEGNALQYVRLTDLDLSGDGSALIALKEKGVHGAVNRTGNPELFGTYSLTTYLDPSLVAELQAYFEHLTIYNAQCTVIEFDDTLTYDGNVTNMDNGTYDGNGGLGYVPSGHIVTLMRQLHAYRGEFLPSRGVMQLKQISDDDIEQLVDGTASNLDDQSLNGHDIFVRFPRYWYKGVNDHLNQKKYFCLSTELNEPRSSAHHVTRHTLGNLLVAADRSVYIDDFAVGDTFSTSQLATTEGLNSVYRMDVTGMKRVRWPGINSQTVGCLFLDASGKVLSKVSGYIAHALTDYILGDYVFVAVPSGAASFVFTSVQGQDTLECIAVDSLQIEAMEPDWVLHEECLVGMYKASRDSQGRLRSVSGVTPVYGSNTNGTASYWNYDEQGELTVGQPQTSVTMNRSMKDLSNLAKCRGAGYQLVDYEMHKDIANLWMALYGRRNSQAINGSGVNYGTATGGSNTATVSGVTYKSPMRESSGSQRPRSLGLEDWACNGREWMDGVMVNVSSFAGWYRSFKTNKPNGAAPSGSMANAVWHVLMPDGTERAVQGVSGSTEICRVRHGRYCDVVPSKLVTNSSWDTYYCDQQEYNASTARAVARSGSNVNAFYGFVYVNASSDSSFANFYIGSRLAFRGECEIVE